MFRLTTLFKTGSLLKAGLVEELLTQPLTKNNKKTKNIVKIAFLNMLTIVGISIYLKLAINYKHENIFYRTRN